MSRDRQVFISYARDDGETAAVKLHDELQQALPGVNIWMDRGSMVGGESWWRQIADAIENSEYLIAVMTPAAIDSEIVRREWLYARRHGVCVCPVQAKKLCKEDLAKMPRWMNKSHFYDIEREWDTLLNQLKAPCQIARVAFMAPELPRRFVQRPGEFEGLKQLLLTSDKQDPVAITTALHGAGGFGKTTLAAALCHDLEVQSALADGILWATVGKESPDVLGNLIKLHAALTGKRITFVDIEDAVVHLAEALQHKDCLVVIDDIWRAADLQPFLRPAKDCAILVTTRFFDIVSDYARLPVDEMESSEAIEMLTSQLEPRPTDTEPFRKLAARLGEWPLLLELAGGALRQRVSRGDDIDNALDYLNEKLDRKGVFAFDRRDTDERNEAVRLTVDVSLDLLEEDERQRCLELGIFPEDIDIPLDVVGQLWGLDEFETEELAMRLADFSLIRFDIRKKTIHLHDLMQACFLAALENSEAVHGRLFAVWGDPCDLPSDYAWQWYGYHMLGAGRRQEFRKLLLDYAWLQAKLNATDVLSMIRDCGLYPKTDASIRLLQGTLRLAAHILGDDKKQLAGQLHGRLLQSEEPELKALLNSSRPRKHPWLRPTTPSLTPPESGELQTFAGHDGWVTALAVTPDGKRALSGSGDNTLKLWDLESGDEILSFTCDDAVHCCAVSPDGRTIVAGGPLGRLQFLRLEGIWTHEVTFSKSNHALAAEPLGEVKARDIIECLRLARPGAVLEIIGGASELTNSKLERLRPIFENALAPLAASEGAAVFDGGTDAGVMRLMGRTRAAVRGGFPLIGVAPRVLVCTPEAPWRDEEDVLLEPNHSHFVLTPGSRWGDESPWMSDIVSELSKEVPAVTVLINGGDVARRDVELSLGARRPVVVIAGTGRLADELAALPDKPSLMKVVYLEEGLEKVKEVIGSLM